jgi:4-amino-4-deoxychorismate lyase
MCHLIETIAIENGQFRNIEYHNQRFNKTRSDLFNEHNVLDIAQCTNVKSQFDTFRSSAYNLNHLWKCRVIYGKSEDGNPILKVSFQPYQTRKISQLKAITSNEINYMYKYEDRDRLNDLYALKGDADDILIIQNGLFADGSIYNIVFQRENKLFTPANPLLKGTKRQELLDSELIQEEKIGLNDLKYFEGVWLINAMNNLGDIPFIKSAQILCD